MAATESSNGNQISDEKYSNKTLSLLYALIFICSAAAGADVVCASIFHFYSAINLTFFLII
jgi:hypothetical protein